MRRWFGFLCVVLVSLPLLATSWPTAGGGTRPATAEEQAWLHTALHKTADDYRRWAYTEHRLIKDEKGRVKSHTLLRHDPSKPYAEQWTPLQVDGREPTDRDRAKFRKRGERSAPSDNPMAEEKKSRRPALGEVLDLPRAFISSETATHWVFEIPLLKVGNERFPPEKFQVLVRMRKEGAVLENIAANLRGSFRSKLVVKVKSGEGSLDFEVVDPKYPPALVRVEGDASASLLFVSVGGSVNVKRTELKHVKPFDERFDVQIGTLRSIDF
jgi:hypothetical protein